MPDSQTLNTLLNTYGIANPISGGGGINWGYWIANIFFGIIGWYAFIYGWKHKSIRPSVIGIVLMVYPYFVSNTFFAFAIGIALTAALYFWRE
jgi:hypothetical protein